LNFRFWIGPNNEARGRRQKEKKKTGGARAVALVEKAVALAGRPSETALFF
jgi:hypothetical protein